MIRMGNTDVVKVVREALPYDDDALLEAIYDLEQDIEARREHLRKQQASFNGENYLCLAVARLAYEFAVDDYNALIIEAARRELITGRNAL